MADKKITDLPDLTSADSGDYFPIVDISANVTKKVPASGLAGAIAANFASNAIVKAKLERPHFHSLFYSTGGAGGGVVITNTEVNPQFDASDSNGYGITANTGASSNMVVNRDGVYSPAFQVTMSDGSTTSTFICWLDVSTDGGSTYTRFRQYDRALSTAGWQTYSWPSMWCASGTILKLTVYNGGGNIRLAAASGSTFNQRYYQGPRFSVTEIR